jgi:hypothetical protein
MAAIGKATWFALMNSKSRGRHHVGFSREPSRRSREKVALLTHLLQLAALFSELVSF